MLFLEKDVSSRLLCRHPLLLSEWLKGQAGVRRNAAKSTSTRSVSLRQLANRKENMSDSDGGADGQNVSPLPNTLLYNITLHQQNLFTWSRVPLGKSKITLRDLYSDCFPMFS